MIDDESTLMGYIASNEGFREMVYDDKTGEPLKKGDTISGIPTVGFGRNLADKGVTGPEALVMLANDVRESLNDLTHVIPDLTILPANVRRALVDMRYNLGPTRFRTFEKLIAAINDKDFVRAADEALDSKYADQLPNRARKNARLIRNA